MASVEVTPEIIAGVYDVLRKASPFRSWKMPRRDSMVFKITRRKDWRGYFCALKSGNVIAVSDRHIRSWLELEAVIAHEMLHAHMNTVCPHEPHHGVVFQKKANVVCSRLELDRGIF